MKAILLLFDSLNRHCLGPYGCDWTRTPNFQRLAAHTVQFDRCYAGSLPCMPARRELHTGRYNFLHRSWGPIEPFDDSMPEMLKENGIYTHLVSDHQHYWEDGGATYHTRYSSWECVRGQEGDPWKAQVEDPEIPPHLGQASRQDTINRAYCTPEERQPLAQVFSLAQEFLTCNCKADNWLLQIEPFDPHEPFFVPEAYQQLYPDQYAGPPFDWPPYDRVSEPLGAAAHCRNQYGALLSMCDAYLGKVLDFMDAHDMWQDTMLIVTTDHGFLLGEHNWWAKNRPHFMKNCRIYRSLYGTRAPGRLESGGKHWCKRLIWRRRCWDFSALRLPRICKDTILSKQSALIQQFGTLHCSECSARISA